MSDDVNSGGEIKLVHMGSWSSMTEYGGMGGHQFTKVVQDEASKNFLGDELRPFRVKMFQANGVLEITESGFNAPAMMIKLFESGGRERISIQVGDQVFPDARRDFNRNHAKIKRVKKLALQVTEVKADIFREDAIERRIRFDQICLFSGQDDVKIQVESGIQGKV